MLTKAFSISATNTITCYLNLNKVPNRSVDALSPTFSIHLVTGPSFFRSHHKLFSALLLCDRF